jgi:hypothetical protein
LSALTEEQAVSDITSATPLKPTTTALKALFLTAFIEFLLNISASFEVPITSIRFIVDYRNKRSQAPWSKYLLRRVASSVNLEQNRSDKAWWRVSPFFIDIDIVLIETLWRHNGIYDR